MADSGEALEISLQVADWRRHMNALYQQVRDRADPIEGWTLWRAGRDSLFAEHPQTPLTAEAQAGFVGLDYFPYDQAMRFEVALDAIEGSVEDWDIGADGVLHPRAVARTRGLSTRLGGELTVYWLTAYGGGLFLPFTDASSGDDTYAGGRYVLDSIKGADLGMAAGRLILDFNLAFYPSCAHNLAWTCPLAPAENRLPRRIEAGERG